MELASHDGRTLAIHKRPNFCHLLDDELGPAGSGDDARRLVRVLEVPLAVVDPEKLDVMAIVPLKSASSEDTLSNRRWFRPTRYLVAGKLAPPILDTPSISEPFRGPRLGGPQAKDSTPPIA
jgi:hypothetical protein